MSHVIILNFLSSLKELEMIYTEREKCNVATKYYVSVFKRTIKITHMCYLTIFNNLFDLESNPNSYC